MRTPSVSAIEKWILQKIYASIGRPPIRLALGRGPEVGPTNAEPVASVLISDWRTLTRLLLNPEIGFGDGYAEGRIEVEGDLVILLETVLRTMKAYDVKNPVSCFGLNNARAHAEAGGPEHLARLVHQLLCVANIFLENFILLGRISRSHLRRSNKYPWFYHPQDQDLGALGAHLRNERLHCCLGKLGTVSC